MFDVITYISSANLTEVSTRNFAEALPQGWGTQSADLDQGRTATVGWQSIMEKCRCLYNYGIPNPIDLP